LVPGVIPTGTPTTGFPTYDLPVRSAFYNLTPVGVNAPEFLDDSNSVFIPIHEGFQLNLGAFYTSTGSARVFFSSVSAGGTASGSNIIPASTGPLFSTVYTTAPGEIGIRHWVSKFTAAAATITLSALHARLSPIGETPRGPQKWVGGQGHSGCRFATFPTYINQAGTDGGQVQYAASFREVGSWSVG